LAALDGSTGTNAETLLRSALGLHLGHFMLRLLVLVRRRGNDFRALLAPSHLSWFSPRLESPKALRHRRTGEVPIQL
jgi:hypothetical protein